MNQKLWYLPVILEVRIASRIPPGKIPSSGYLPVILAARIASKIPTGKIPSSGYLPVILAVRIARRIPLSKIHIVLDIYPWFWEPRKQAGYLQVRYLVLNILDRSWYCLLANDINFYDRSSYGSQKSPRQGRSKTRWEESTQHKSYSSSVPMAGLPMAGALFGVCLGDIVLNLSVWLYFLGLSVEIILLNTFDCLVFDVIKV